MTPYLVKVPMLHWHLAVVLVAFLLLLEVAPGTALKAGEHDRGKHREQLRTVHHTKHRHHHSRHHQDSTMAVHSKGLAVTMNEETLAAANASAAQLDYWTDVQPVDTALGQFFVAGLQERPTSTPLPLQASLDVVRAGCPMMLTWPREVDVLAINPCDSQHIGVWRNHATNESLVEYYQSCSPFSGGLAPIATYTMAEGGHVLAETQMGVTMFGTRIHLMDCRGSTRYMIEEKVHHETKGRDQRSCEKFGSCDGVIWIQYLIYKDDELVAQTPFLHLFQSIVRIVDPTTGSNIAVAKRLGDWDPNIADCQGQRQWHLTYVPAEEMPAGPFNRTTEQWPIAAMISVMSLRDQHRKPNGLLGTTFCNVYKGFLRFTLITILLVAFVVGFLVFLRDAVPPLRAGLWELELKVCRRRMLLPTKYTS